MKKITKKMSVILLGCGIFLLGACGGSNDSGDSGEEKITYTLNAISATGDNPTLEYAISKVKEEYPNVEFELEDFPQDGGQALRTRAATGDLPDIMWLNSGLINPLSNSGSLLELDEYVKELDFNSKINVPAQENSMVSPDGHNYVFAADGVAPILWYYNKALFAEHNIKVPENYPELLEAVERFNEEDVIPMSLFGQEPWPLGAFFDAFALKNNPAGALGLSNGEGKASDVDYAEAIRKMHEVVDAGMFQSGVTNADYDTAFALFASGRAAMFQNGIWNVPDVTAALGEDAGYFITYPTGDAGSTTNDEFYAGGGDTVGYGVTKDVENPDLAAKVASILAISHAEYNYTELGNISSTVDFEQFELINPLPKMSEELVTEIPNMKFESAMLQNFPNIKFSTGFAEEVQKLLVGEDVDVFIQNIDNLIESSKE